MSSILDVLGVREKVERFTEWAQRNGAEDEPDYYHRVDAANAEEGGGPLDPLERYVGVIHNASYYDDSDSDVEEEEGEEGVYNVEYSDENGSDRDISSEDEDDDSGGGGPSSPHSEYEDDYISRIGYTSEDVDYDASLRAQKRDLFDRMGQKRCDELSLADINSFTPLVRERLAFTFEAVPRPLGFVDAGFFDGYAILADIRRITVPMTAHIPIAAFLTGAPQTFRLVDTMQLRANSNIRSVSELWPQEIRIKVCVSTFQGSICLAMPTFAGSRRCVFHQQLTEQRRECRRRPTSIIDTNSNSVSGASSSKPNNAHWLPMVPASRGQHLLIDGKWRSNAWATLMAGRTADDLRTYCKEVEYLREMGKCLLQKNVLTLLLMDTLMQGKMDPILGSTDYSRTATQANYRSDYTHYEIRRADYEELLVATEPLMRCAALEDITFSVSLFGDDSFCQAELLTHEVETITIHLVVTIRGRISTTTSALAATLSSEKRETGYGQETILDETYIGSQDGGRNLNNTPLRSETSALVEKED